MHNQIKIPLLIDFDGVIRLGNKLASDAKIFFDFIIKNKFPAHIISNSTLKDSTEIKNYLAQNNIETNIPIMTSVDTTLDFVKTRYKKIAVYAIDPVKNLFNEMLDYENPEAVIVGDLGDRWSYENLNDIFRKVNSGADFIAMQKNKFWKPDGKTLTMDAGSFIKAIEYAASKEAILIGKPSQIYFQTALKKLGWKDGDNFYMIGDDVETDIKPAQNIGGKGILIYTGKTQYPYNDENFNPSFEVRTLSDAIKILEN